MAYEISQCVQTTVTVRLDYTFTITAESSVYKFTGFARLKVYHFR